MIIYAAVLALNSPCVNILDLCHYKYIAYISCPHIKKITVQKKVIESKTYLNTLGVLDIYGVVSYL